MAASLPYLASNKNIETLFTTVQSAKVPDRFTQEFLATTIGLKGTNDRAMIPLLRNLGFLDQSGSPTPAYRQLKNKETARPAIASGIRTAYAPLFESNEDANTLPSEKLKGLIAQVAGTDDDMTARIASTFNALVKQADFSKQLAHAKGERDDEPEIDIATEDEDGVPNATRRFTKGLNPQFHYNIQIHLPSNATEEVYLNIFNAIRKTFQ
ncbi:DUF5343 domain-containing protein [Bordetella genomosp. 8]|uniref:DUF5343 domain-containing protein n=1 Tax=Bordetella genomosp. 8 TaxID=1416806 RepID=UPI0012FDD9D2|nr:DUF5343 domain-containing protein [Bordetella genomosp. 8]